MINVADLPAVRAQFERDAAAAKTVPTPHAVEPVRYARAPAGAGPQAAGSRPPATQRNNR